MISILKFNRKATLASKKIQKNEANVIQSNLGLKGADIIKKK
jgi:hypothetical protein